MLLENEVFFGGWGYDNLSGPSHRLPYFMRIFFSSTIDASVNLVRGFPGEWKKKQQKKQKTNAKSMDRSWKFQDIVSQKLEWTWLFMWLH